MPDDHNPRGVDRGDVRIRRRDDGIELLVRHGRTRVAGALTRAVELLGVGFDDRDLEAGQPQWRCVDAGEAELEHACRRLSEQLDDPRRCRSGQRRR
ncbi:MAG TPA: hypothetical protein VLE97_07790 [Gaiellaceae bacterium]|nr:hypothetical protein [Gaiellaceae bacterium]